VLAFADRQFTVVRVRGHATLQCGFQQGDQGRVGFHLGERVQPAQRFIVIEMGDVWTRQFALVIDRRIIRAQAERRIQCPFVGFGGGVQLVDRRRERERCAAAMFAHAHRALGPAQRAAQARDVVAPTLRHGGIHDNAGRLLEWNFKRGAGAIEIQVVAGQPA